MYQAAELAGEEPPQYLNIRKHFADLAQPAQAGDAAIGALFNRAGHYLGRALANHVNMQDPERIVILTRNSDLIALISGPFFEVLHRDTLPVLRDPSRVTFKQIDEASFARGAAAMVLEWLYQER